MPDSGLHPRQQTLPAFTADAADAQLVGHMRLVLASAVLLAVYLDPKGLSGVSDFSRPLFVAYLLHSLVIVLARWQQRAWTQHKAVHWLDVGWYAVIVLATHGVNSYFFLFFFFAILTASFRWGHDEGARVTVVSATAFALTGLFWHNTDDLPRLLLRTSFLLTLGYLCVHWGETQVRLTRRLALLRDVSRLSNPRFGVDHTLAHVLERTRAAYGAAACVLVLRDTTTRQACLRSAGLESGAQSAHAEPLSEDAARQLLPFDDCSVISHRQSRWPWLPLTGTQACPLESGRWRRPSGQDEQGAQHMAELLDCPAFISAPVRLRQSEGRIYVSGERHCFSKADALFLTHIVAQAFPVIENIELLDRIASDAAAQERRKLALDLHDSAVQPYIGLKMALSALRHRAGPDNPLGGELDKISAMTDQVVGDLRRYAGRVRQPDGQAEPLILSVLQQQAAQVREFYGIDIAVKVRGHLPVNDRLTAEVLQVVREGLSNICRHTLAQRGEVELQCLNGWLGIKIENDATGQLAPDFTPRSITERAVALGGRAHVRQTSGGRTAIHVHIPV